MTYFFTPFRVVLIFIAVALLSIAIIPSLQVDLLPGDNSRQLYVSVSMPRSTPLLMEQQVTSVLENGFSQLPGVKQIKSVSRSNRGIVTLEFDAKTDMQQKRFELTALIRQLSRALPAGASYPVVSGGNESRSGKSPLLIYTINAPQQPFMISKHAHEILNKLLAGKDGISEVLVTGAPQLQLSVTFDMEQCRALGTSPDDIMALLQNALQDGFPGYAAAGNGHRYFLYMKAGAPDISTIENMPLPLKPPAVIRLKNVARIYLEEQPARQFFRVNGKNSVFASVYVHEGENRIAMARSIKKLLSAQELWPPGYEAFIAFDDAEFLREELGNNYRRILLSLGILLLFILITYRNFRHLLLLATALLINTSLTIILVYIAGIPVHLYTIAGMAISFGIVLDTLIIMLDYFRQFRNRKVFTAMLASACILISALLLVYLLPDGEQRNLEDLAGVICLALVSSLAVSLWFIPGLYSLLHGRAHATRPRMAYLRRTSRYQHTYARVIGFIARGKMIFCTAIVLLFGLPVFLLPNDWKGEWWYKLLGGTSTSFVNNMQESSGFRDPAQDKLFIEAALPPGNTPRQMNNIIQEAEKYIAGERSIDKFVTRVYDGQSGLIEITFKKEYEHTAVPFQLKSRLAARSLEWGGVEWNIYGVGQAFSNSTAIENGRFRVTMKGYNYDQLEQQAQNLANKLRVNKRVQNVNTAELLNFSDKITGEYVLAIDAGRMALQQADQSTITMELAKRAPPAGPAGFASMNNTLYPVMMKEKHADDYSAHDLLQRPIFTDSNKTVRLNDFATLSFRPAVNAIYRENRQYVRAIGFNFLGPEESGNKYLRNVLDTFNRYSPPGYTAEKTNVGMNAGSTLNYALLVFLLIAASFFICSMLFESLKQPFLIICSVPVSFIGLFIIFPAGNFFFDQGGYGAFVMLGGLVVSSAIFIINDLNSLRNKRNDARLHNKMLVRAVANRSRTVLLTTLSNICGLIPFLIEGDGEVFWFSFAVGTSAGLLFSLLGLFLVLPVLLWKRLGKLS